MSGLRKTAAILMMISGVTHVGQLFVYGRQFTVAFAAAYGSLYFFIGVGLWRRARRAPFLGAVLPSIGGVLGLYRFFFLQRNPFTVFHGIVNLIVIPSCIYLHLRQNGSETDHG